MSARNLMAENAAPVVVAPSARLQTAEFSVVPAVAVTLAVVGTSIEAAGVEPPVTPPIMRRIPAACATDDTAVPELSVTACSKKLPLLCDPKKSRGTRVLELENSQ